MKYIIQISEGCDLTNLNTTINYTDMITHFTKNQLYLKEQKSVRIDYRCSNEITFINRMSQTIIGILMYLLTKTWYLPIKYLF